MINKYIKLYFVIIILSISGCSIVKVKGRVVPYKHGNTSNYIPLIGNVMCGSHDVVSSKNISEKYSEYGAVIDIWNGGFPYRLDMHLTNNKQIDSAFNYKGYFQSEALPHILKDYPNGELIDESIQTTDNKQVYFSAIYYPKHRGGLFESAFEIVRSQYRILIVYKDKDVIYTTSRFWPGVYGDNIDDEYEVDKKYIINDAIRNFHNCKYGTDADFVEKEKEILPSTITIKIVDSPNYNNDLFRYVDWNNEHYSPGAFIAVVKNRGVTRVNLTDSNVEKEQCVAYIGKKLNAKIYNVDSENIFHEMKQAPKLKACSIH